MLKIVQRGDLINSKDAAVVLDSSRATVNRLAASGRLATAVKAPGVRGDRFFRRSDVEALAAARRKPEAD